MRDPVHRLIEMSDQCDQMTRLFFQSFAIYNDKILPKSIQKVPKWVHNFSKYQRNLSNVAKDLLIFANLAKFRQIWSRCSPEAEKSSETLFSSLSLSHRTISASKLFRSELSSIVFWYLKSEAKHSQDFLSLLNFVALKFRTKIAVANAIGKWNTIYR